jgi:hypothetical protein
MGMNSATEGKIAEVPKASLSLPNENKDMRLWRDGGCKECDQRL